MLQNSQLGPGRTADLVDGAVGKVYIAAGCVSERRVYSARIILWEVLGVTDCQYEHVTSIRIFPAPIVF